MKKIIYTLLLGNLVLHAGEGSFTDIVRNGILRVTHAVLGKDLERWKWGRIAWRSQSYLASIENALKDMQQPVFVPVAWSRVQPDKDTFDYAYMTSIEHELAQVSTNGQRPMVCLCGDDVPAWFLKEGGFKQEHASDYFIRYAAHVIECCASYDPIIITFAAPARYAMRGYFLAEQEPFITSMETTGNVLLNMLETHVRCYTYAKQKWPSLSIGIGHAYMVVYPKYHAHPVERGTAALFDRLLHQELLHYFADGSFTWSVPLHTYVRRTVQHHPLDCIMIDYHGAYELSLTRTGFTISEPQFYPEGFYQAMQATKQLSVPYYCKVTLYDPYGRYSGEAEQKHMIAVHKAMQHGISIAGYVH